MPHRPPRPEKTEGGIRFASVSGYEPAGDQPQAIAELVDGVRRFERDQVLLGVTGSGKTFTMAKVIEATQRPALILAPNKTLAAQLYGEFKSFFPNNAVEYFVSYYDYYQPEAYVPRTDTYIEKESSINEQIDRMRHAATRALMERDDVIIVASVSCIYGIGSVETYTAMTFGVKVGDRVEQRQLIADLVALQYRRNARRFRARLLPRARRRDRGLPGALRGSRLAPLAVRRRGREHRRVRSAHRTEDGRSRLRQVLRQLALCDAAPDLAAGDQGHQGGAALAPRRARALGAGFWRRSAWSSAPPSTSRCSRPRAPAPASRIIRAGSPAASPASRRRPCSNICPTTRLSSPTRAMSPSRRSAACIGATSAARRRSPNTASACRPASTTGRCASRNGRRCARRRCMSRRRPAHWELERTGGVFVEQVIRPTGLDRSAGRDPPGALAGRRSPGRGEGRDREAGYRSLVTMLTKRMAEDLTEYMHEHGVRVRYMHSDIDTLERIEIIRDLRLGAFDVLVGINLLARRPRHSRMRAGRHPRRRQGRLPALGDLAHPDHRPRGAQCRRQGRCSTPTR